MSFGSDNVDGLIEQAHAELVRVDSKAQAVLTGAGLVFAAGAAVGAADLPASARFAAGAAQVFAAAAVVLLLAAIRPNLAGQHGFVRLARFDLNALAAAAADEVSESTRLRRLQWTAQATARKYQRIRVATTTLYGAVLAVLATAVLVLMAL